MRENLESLSMESESSGSDTATSGTKSKSIQVNLVEVAQKRKFTRQSPDMCLSLVDRGVVNHFGTVNLSNLGFDNSTTNSNLNALTLTVHCRWLRYPQASSLSISHQDLSSGSLMLSSIGIRNSEERAILQAVQREKENEEFFKSLLAWYVAEHRIWREAIENKGLVQTLAESHGTAGSESDSSESESDDSNTPRLRGAIIAICYGLPFCGGHGDRVHGILSLFLLAIATKRGFLLDVRHPTPLQGIVTTNTDTNSGEPESDTKYSSADEGALHPSFLDWRVRTEDVYELAAGNRIQLMDELEDKEVERILRGVKRSPEVLVIGSNLRFHTVGMEW